ncbi:1-phosphofructokinase family hexose kinase [Stutzerimonas tarimensis]|uniref:Phosphofructokinase n=1 Tax=Stutzerimonas tarimensis TaxID=1507735 RepID=A0ABV7TC28_9GAMM
MPRIVTLTLNPTVDISTRTSRVEHTSKLRCELPRRDPGGGGINVARVVNALGADAVGVFPAGGPCGAMLCQSLDEMGVPHRAVPITGETRESFTVAEAETGLQYRFVMPGPSLSEAELRGCLHAIETLDPAPDCLVVSGSYPPDVPLSFHDQLLALSRRLDIPMVLDSSGEALRHAVRTGGLFLIKPSLHELAYLRGESVRTAEEQDAAVAELVVAGVADIVVLSLGENGAVAATRDGVRRFPAIPVSEGSAVGAGDTMVAATTLALLQGWEVWDAVRYGMAAGAATVMSPGTALCAAEDVERLYRISALGA